MATIQVVLDAELLKAADKIVRRTKQNRSALIRHALREYLKKLDIQEKVQRERNGYLALPQSQNEVAMWESEQVWPE
jgi:metal-responsive CopG/Arc/MetJ family transcriptional regulator